jgi:hypothetical protein
MKAFKIKMVSLALLIVAATGCSKKFEEYSLNKNLPQTVPPGVLLRGVLNSIVTYPGGYEDKAGQFYVSNYTYYGDNKYWTGSADLSYGALNNVLNMEKQAYNATGTSNNPYHALGLFLRAFHFVEMSEKVGDIPVSEALLGTGNVTPKYDSQKEVFLQSLNNLDSANTILTGLLSTGFLEFSGDFFFKEALSGKYGGGNGRDALVQWQKVVNSYALRLLIELSKKDGDADLAVKAKFANIFNNPSKYPIFTSNDDNLQYVYNATYNYYPNNVTNYGNDAGRLNVGGTLLNNLSALNDIRAMYLAEPARGLGFGDTDYRSFKGADLGQDLSAAGRRDLALAGHPIASDWISKTCRHLSANNVEVQSGKRLLLLRKHTRDAAPSTRWNAHHHFAATTHWQRVQAIRGVGDASFAAAES